jgi:hypothetical protein
MIYFVVVEISIVEFLPFNEGPLKILTKVSKTSQASRGNEEPLGSTRLTRRTYGPSLLTHPPRMRQTTKGGKRIEPPFPESFPEMLGAKPHSG